MEWILRERITHGKSADGYGVRDEVTAGGAAVLVAELERLIKIRRGGARAAHKKGKMSLLDTVKTVVEI